MPFRNDRDCRTDQSMNEAEASSQSQESEIPLVYPAFTDSITPHRHRAWIPGTALCLAVTAIVTGLCVGGEWGFFALSALGVVPFAVLATLAYLGEQRL